MDALTRSFARYRQDGDLDALGRVFDSASPRLLALALHLCGNAADAEDALQATFLVAMQKSTSFDLNQAVAPWLLGILAGEANNVRRREQRRNMAELPDQVPSGDVGVGDAAEHRELVAQLRTRIDALPDEQRQVLLLQLQHGLQPAEIAEVLSVPPGTVRMRIHRGLATLRRVLPAGLAITLLALFPQRGIAAVRASVMQAGAVEAAAATAIVVTIGGIAMKKVVLTVVAMAAACLVWWAAWPPAAQDVPTDSSPGAAVASVVGDDKESGGDVAADDSQATSRVERDPVALAPGTLRVRVRGDAIMKVSRMIEVASSSQGSGVLLAGVLVELWAGELDSDPVDGLPWMANTDSAGLVQFGELLPGPYRVAVSAGGGRCGEPREVVILGADTQEIEVHVACGGILQGRVLDEVGAAVGGAQVWVGKRVQYAGHAGRHLRVAAVSGSDGEFSIAHVRGEDYVAARKAGYGASLSFPIEQLGAGDIELRLGSAATLVRGEIVDSGGRPMVNVSVVVEPRETQTRRAVDGTLLGPRLGLVVQTDAGGRFLVDGLAPGVYTVIACQRPHPVVKKVVRLLVGDHKQMRLILNRGLAVHGYLLDRAGKAKSSVLVDLTQGTASRALFSNQDGSYRFEAIKHEPFTLTAIRLPSGARVAKQCSAPTGADVRVDLVLDEGPALLGRVQTQSGRAVSDWCVTVFYGDGNSDFREAKTQPDGTFTVWDLPPGTLQVHVHRDEGKARTPDQIVVGEVGHQLDVTLPEDAVPMARCTGRIVDRNGQPIVVAWVTRYGASMTPPVEVDADGRFSMVDMEVGTCELIAGADGYVGVQRRVELNPNQQYEFGDLELIRGATLRVRYRRPDGQPWHSRPPIPWLRDPRGGLLRPGQIDNSVEGGDVVVTRIPPGTYDVLGPFDDELLIDKAAVELRAGEVQELELSVQVGRRRKLNFGMMKLESLRVTVRRGDGLLVFDEVVRNRQVAIEVQVVLPMGDLRVEASHEGVVHYAGDIRIEAGLEDVATITIPSTK